MKTASIGCQDLTHELSRKARPFRFCPHRIGRITRAQPFGGWSIQWVSPLATTPSAAATLLFVVPSGKENGDKLLDWESASKIPWGLLILFGGGIAIAKAFGASGLFFGHR